MDIIFPYVKSVQLFVCPSRTEPETTPSYGYNRLSHQGAAAPAGGYGIALAQIQRPAEIVLTMDYPIVYGIYANGTEYCGTSSSGFLNPSNSFYNRVYPHLEGGTVNFTDGHSKWYKRGARSVCIPGAVMTNQPAWNPALP